MKFIFIGLLNTLFTIFLYELLVTFVHYQIAFGISYLTGFFISLYFNTRYTYKARLTLKKCVLFFLSNVIGFCLGLFMNHMGVEFLSINQRLIFIVTSILLLGYNFIMGKIILEEILKKEKTS